LDAGEHEHEVGEDTDGCPNCVLLGKAASLTDFEGFCLAWHYENVNNFTIEAGILGEAVKELKLSGVKRRLFSKAQNMIRYNTLVIEAEKQREAIRKQK
jgi:hypothetical protein